MLSKPGTLLSESDPLLCVAVLNYTLAADRNGRGRGHRNTGDSSSGVGAGIDFLWHLSKAIILRKGIYRHKDTNPAVADTLVGEGSIPVVEGRTQREGNKPHLMFGRFVPLVLVLKVRC